MTHQTLNQLVNAALFKWAEVTKVDPGARSFTVNFGNGSGAFTNYDLVKRLEDLNESRELDPSGLSTLMMLRGLTDHHLRTTAFSAHEIFAEPEGVKQQLKAMRELRDLIESHDYDKVMDGFVQQMYKAADYYGVPDGRNNKDLQELLDNKYELAMIRRDALRSLKKLDAHQFTYGKPDPGELKYNKLVFEFWNINSLLKATQNQEASGISLCLLRDPDEALHSFFAFAIRNGQTLTVLTDREEGAHPQANSMSRRPDRGLERRAALHWFPYQLLQLEQSADGDHLFAKQRDALVPYNVEAAPLKKIGELWPEQFVWLVLMFDLIRDEYGRNNLQLPEPSYTGEMVVRPDALVGRETALVKDGVYKPLEAPPLTHGDVTLEATKEQWARESTRFNAWMEERYGPQVDEAFLNPVGEQQAKLLADNYSEEHNLAKRDEKGKIDFKDRSKPALGELHAVSPIDFGTAKKLEDDRRWAGRHNKMVVIQRLAEKEYAATREETLAWYEEKVRANAEMLLDAAARGVLELPGWQVWNRISSFEHNYRDQTPTNIIYQRHDGEIGFYGYGPKLHSGVEKRRSTGWRRHWYETGRYYCFERPNVIGNVLTRFSPQCPEAIAIIAGVDVEDLPLGLRHWYSREPYSGNHILNRLDPSDWKLSNPWMRDRHPAFGPQVLVVQCKRALNARRKALGLPRRDWSKWLEHNDDD